jgi:hexokinase
MRGTSDQLFDFIADCVKDFMDKNHSAVSSQKAPLGIFFIPRKI